MKTLGGYILIWLPEEGLQRWIKKQGLRDPKLSILLKRPICVLRSSAHLGFGGGPHSPLHHPSVHPSTLMAPDRAEAVSQPPPQPWTGDSIRTQRGWSRTETNLFINQLGSTKRQRRFFKAPPSTSTRSATSPTGPRGGLLHVGWLVPG